MKKIPVNIENIEYRAETEHISKEYSMEKNIFIQY
jgi:hypothetical protein